MQPRSWPTLAEFGVQKRQFDQLAHEYPPEVKPIHHIAAAMRDYAARSRSNAAINRSRQG